MRRWFPAFSMEFLRANEIGHGAVCPRLPAPRSALTKRPRAQLIANLHDMFPHVSVEDIAADLANTGNFDMTVDNLLSGRAIGAAGVLGAVRRDAPRAAGAAAAAAPAAPPLHEAAARQAPPEAGQDVLEAQDVAALLAEPAAAPAAATAAGPPSAARDAAVEAPHEPWPRVGDDW
jgi:hypothetical protein